MERLYRPYRPGKACTIKAKNRYHLKVEPFPEYFFHEGVKLFVPFGHQHVCFAAVVAKVYGLFEHFLFSGLLDSVDFRGCLVSIPGLRPAYLPNSFLILFAR